MRARTEQPATASARARVEGRQEFERLAFTYAEQLLERVREVPGGQALEPLEHALEYAIEHRLPRAAALLASEEGMFVRKFEQGEI